MVQIHNKNNQHHRQSNSINANGFVLRLVTTIILTSPLGLDLLLGLLQDIPNGVV